VISGALVGSVTNWQLAGVRSDKLGMGQGHAQARMGLRITPIGRITGAGSICSNYRIECSETESSDASMQQLKMGN
jgi:hypothetical protein